MKTLLLQVLFGFLLMTPPLSAQQHGGGMGGGSWGGGGGGMMREPQRNAPRQAGRGKIIGLVVDKATNQPLEYATIVIKRAGREGGRPDGAPVDSARAAQFRARRDSVMRANGGQMPERPQANEMIGGAVSGKDGKFKVENVPNGRFIAEISFIGYLKITVPVTVQGEVATVDVGTVQLEEDTAQIGEVNVDAQRDLVTTLIDKKIYSVQNDPQATGQNVSEVLTRVPSVEVDQDGNISLRGNENVRILLDGRPLPVTRDQQGNMMQQLPASMIESIEIVTNPSAKYDADGMTGILNIITKKNTSTQMQGGSVSLGGNTLGSVNLGGTFNYQKDKATLFANYGLRREVRNGEGSFDRDYLIDNYAINQNSETENKSWGHNLSLRADYALSPETSISLSTFGGLNRGRSESLARTDSSSVSLDPRRDGYFTRSSLDEDDGLNGSVGLNFQHKKNGKEIIFDSNFTTNKRDVDTHNEQYEFQIPTSTTAFRSNLENGLSNNTNRNFTTKLDFATPFVRGSKLELGLKNDMRWLDNVQNYSTLNPFTQTYVPNPSISQSFGYEDVANAAYAIFSQTHGALAYQAGVRGESTKITINPTSTTNQVSRTFTDLFPSASLLYKKDEFNQVQFSYSKRISRPDARQLNTVANSTDLVNQMIGNNQLTPEFTHSLELNFNRITPKASISITPYFGRDLDSIRRYQQLDTLEVNGTERVISRTTFGNFVGGKRYGAEMSVSTKLLGKANMIVGANIYQNINDGGTLPGDIYTKNMVYSGNMNLTVPLSRSISFNYNMRYRSKNITGTGGMRAMLMTDAALTWRTMGNKGTFNLRMNDVLGTQKFSFESKGYDDQTLLWMQEGYRRGPAQIVNFNFTYNFGQRIRVQERNRPDQRPRDDMDF